MGSPRESGGAPPSDHDLLAAVADADPEALRQLYDRHAPWLAARLRGRCSDPALVEDALQETFVAVWRGAKNFAGTGDVPAWLWGIGIRRLISQLRRRHVRVEIPVPDLPRRSTRATVTVEDLVLQGLEYGRLGPALQSLSPEHRAVIRATVLDGLSTREAARLLGVREGTVKSRAYRARAELRAALSSTGGGW